MVYLDKIIENKEREIMSNENPTKWLYCYIFDIKIPDGEYSNENAISYKGYKHLDVDSTSIDKCINNSAKMNYTSSIPLFIGVHLADYKQTYFERVVSFYQNLKNNKQKYVFTLCFPKLKGFFKTDIQKMAEDKQIYEYLCDMSSGDFQICPEINENDIDVFDLILVKKIINKDKIFNIYENSIADSISHMLSNFSNSIIKITKDRYNKRPAILIENEYDVQDILFSFFKFYFNDAVRENPLQKKAGSNSIIDICFPERKIYIEIKMLKEKDKNEKEIIDQLKKDMFDYDQKDVAKLIIFIYDPFKKIKDKDNFNDFEKARDGANYSCKVIIQN